MRGELFVYGSNPHGMKLAAFLSFPSLISESCLLPSEIQLKKMAPPLSIAELFQFGPECIVLIGGLTDGLMSLSFAEHLSKKDGVHVAYPVLTSGLTGFGVSSIMQDACELQMLLGHSMLSNFGKITLVGHSTGCQSILHYICSENFPIDSRIRKIVLQAPVSDRDSFLGPQSLTGPMEVEKYCNDFFQNKGTTEIQKTAWEAFQWVQDPTIADDCVYGGPKAVLLGAPLTAGRIRSLLHRLGSEDYFSTDLSYEEIKLKVHAGCVAICRTSDTNGSINAFDDSRINIEDDRMKNVSGSMNKEFKLDRVKEINKAEFNQGEASFQIICALSGLDEYVSDIQAYKNYFVDVFRAALFPVQTFVYMIEGADHACSSHVAEIADIITCSQHPLSNDKITYLS